MKTRFAAVYGPGDIRIEEKELQSPGANQALLKVELCGVCGTDIQINSGRLPIKSPYHNFGHEYSAEVVDVGSGTDWLKPGERVTVNPNYWCGHCDMCRKGFIHLCTEKSGLWTKSNGGFADYALVAADLVHKIPSDMSAERAMFAEPLSCCLHGLSRMLVQPADRIAILGGGTIGLLTLLALKHSGGSHVTISEPVKAKRDLAIKLGADQVVDPVAVNVAQELRDSMNVVIDCTGRPETLADAACIAAVRGSVLALSLYDAGIPSNLEPNLISRKELTIKGAIFAPYRLPDAIDLLSYQSFEAEKLINSTVDLASLPEVMQSSVIKEAVKIAVKPQVT
jgi:threonine dehydrogenase-like Zn-dependent dehydrogenase